MDRLLSVPRYLHLDLGRQTQSNVARFWLHSHTLPRRVKTRSWDHHDGTCDKCGLQAIQDEKHALFLGPCMQMCSLRLQFAYLFHDLPLEHKIQFSKLLSIGLELYISPKLVLRMSHGLQFFRDKLMIPIVLSQSLWVFSVWLVFTSNLNS